MGTWGTQPDSACRCNTPKSLVQDFPTGFIGNPHATPQCDAVQLALTECPVDSQVGVVAVIPFQEIGHATGWFPYPVYNMVPAPESGRTNRLHGVRDADPVPNSAPAPGATTAYGQ